jgi:protein translocase SecG subunit
MEGLATILPYIQMGLAAIMVVGILMQRSEAGLGSAFGDSDTGSKITRRGFEKTLFNANMLISILFVFSILIGLII